jgi:hypothetical protein
MASTSEGNTGGTDATRTLYPVPVIKLGSTKLITLPTVDCAWDGSTTVVVVLAAAKLATVDT